MKKIALIFVFLLTIPFQANAQWFLQETIPNTLLHNVKLVNSSTGWVVGTPGVIFRTTNGGTDWVAQTSGTLVDLWGISFTDTSNGTVVGMEGTILRTTNGGTDWVAQTSGTTKRLNNVFFIDSNNGTVVGDSGTILRTTNGGTDWVAQTSGRIENINDVSFIDANNGTAVGNNYIYRTTNGGASWVTQSVGVGLQAVFFSDANNGTAVGYPGAILRTTDGGSTWTPQSSGTSYFLWDVCFIDAEVGTTVGVDFMPPTRQGIILKTTNGGTTWVTQRDTSNGLFGVSFSDVYNGITVGWGDDYSGIILKTTNGGTTFLPPVLLSVSNGSVNQSINPMFNWSSVPYATNYRFQLSTDSTFQSILIDESNIVNTSISASNLDYLTKYYWRVNASYPFGTSEWSEVWNFTTTAEAPQAPELIAPSNYSINQYLNTTFIWQSVVTALSYRLQVSTDSLFNTNIIDDSTIITTSKLVNLPNLNQKYYWRVQAQNVGGDSPYSSGWQLITLLPVPILSTIDPGNKQIQISWNQTLVSNLQEFKIYRETNPNPTNLIATLPSNQSDYLDSGLNNGTTYYYRIKVISTYGFESEYSNQLSATPNNSPPVAVGLNAAFFPNEGRVLTREVSFNNAGSYDPDGFIDSSKWYVNDEFISYGNNFTYPFLQGTHSVKLVVIDNDGESDTSVTTVTRTMFRKNVNGQVVAGLSLIGSNILYAIVNGDAIYRMDNDGNIDYTLQVGGNLLASSSIANDSTVYIGSTDNNIYAFSKSGTSLWVKALGGAVTTTPTVDILNDRVYVGVSNRNFQFIDRSTGNVLGNYFSDSPINTSAVITSDDKLFFSTSNGTMYGFDLASISFPNVTPTWIINSSDMISSSPAIDSEGFFYVGTSNGLLKKISMQPGLQGTVVWTANLGGSIIASPVIDATGNIYVGSSNDNFYSVDRMNGSIEWSYSFGGQIKTTATISNDANIYFGTSNGYIYCIDTLGTTLWQYEDSSSICSSLLYSDGVLYLGTLDGRIVALYDQVVTESSTLLANNIWGTFQGNNQRTGEQADRLTSIKEENFSSTPTEYIVFDNFPNPFNPSTIIRYALPFHSKVKIEVYNIIGELVKELADLEQVPGYYDITFDAAGLSSGIYIYRIVAQSIDSKNQFSKVKKMILMK